MKKKNMKNSISLILGIIVFISCSNVNDDNFIDQNDNRVGGCVYNSEILSPIGFEVNTIGEINFNGSVKTFQFLDENIGYAMLGNTAGGYVEVLKTIDGGQSWSDLDIGSYQLPRGMIFKDENLGIITVHDVTGCPSDCQHKTVILKTENGGIDWEEIVIEGLQGTLNHPKYDSEGNLYANLRLMNAQTLDTQLTLMISTDDGASWDTLFSSPELDYTFVTFSFEIFEDKIFASAEDEKILVINTEGEYIKTIETGNSSYSGIHDIEVIDEDNLVVVLSGEVIKSANGGETWETIHDRGARMIGFDSADNGLMLLNKGYCSSTGVPNSMDLIASTNNGGLNWLKPEKTTLRLGNGFSNSQKMGDGVWYMMTGKKLIEIIEE